MRVLLLCLLLAACGGPLSLLTGGGPNVAANVQAGKTNVQAVGQTNITEQRLIRPRARTIRQSSDEVQVSAESAGTIVINDTPTWLIIAFAVALFLDSPLRWPGQIWRGLNRR